MDMDMDNDFIKLDATFDFNREHRYSIKVKPYDITMYEEQKQSIENYYENYPEKDNVYDEYGDIIYSNKTIDLDELNIIRDGTKFEANIEVIYYSHKHLDNNENELQYIKFTNIKPLQDNITSYDSQEFDVPFSQVYLKDITAEEEQLVTDIEERITINSNTNSNSNSNTLAECNILDVDGDTIIINGEQFSWFDDGPRIKALLKEQKDKAFKVRSSNIVGKLPTLKSSILSSSSNKKIVLKPSELQKRLTQRQHEPFVFNIGKGGKKSKKKKNYNKVSRKKSNKVRKAKRRVTKK